MSDESKGPIDQLADLFVFAPLGLAFEARDLWPRLADRGRAQLRQARGHGERAVVRSREWAGARVDGAQSEAQSAISGLGLRSGGNGSTTDRSTDGPSAATAAAPARSVAANPTPAAATPTAPAEPAVDVDELAIPDYDALSASQVVPRLAGLAVDELELVRRYESATRGRKTILNKVAQLQAH